MRANGIEVFVIIAVLIGLVIGLVIALLYMLTLKKALDRCSLSSRTMSPGQVFLLFIPLFNIIWHFIVVNQISNSLHNEFQARGITDVEPTPGKTIGLAMCILQVCSIIPIVGIFTGLAGFVCWIVYWVKINEYANRLQPAMYGGEYSIQR